MQKFLDWPGSAGQSYRYWFLSSLARSAIKTAAGNYMFLRAKDGFWQPIYIGIADNLADRLSNHEVWPEAVKMGCTAVYAHLSSQQAVRQKEEKDLIARWNPPLNTHHRSDALMLGSRIFATR